MDHETKRALYESGSYRFKAPPVPAAMWTTENWIMFIDAYNGWIENSEADEISPEDLEAAADYFDKL